MAVTKLRPEGLVPVGRWLPEGRARPPQSRWRGGLSRQPLRARRLHADARQRLAPQYWAVTDAPTVVNLTQHAYFSLNGGEADIRDHVLQMDCSASLPRMRCCPAARWFRRGHASTHVAHGHRRARGRQAQALANAGGYDHNYVVDRVRRARAAPCSTTRRAAAGWRPGCSSLAFNSTPRISSPRGLPASMGRSTGPAMACASDQHAPDAPSQPGFKASASTRAK